MWAVYAFILSKLNNLYDTESPTFTVQFTSFDFARNKTFALPKMLLVVDHDLYIPALRCLEKKHLFWAVVSLLKLIRLNRQPDTASKCKI